MGRKKLEKHINYRLFTAEIISLTFHKMKNARKKYSTEFKIWAANTSMQCKSVQRAVD